MKFTTLCVCISIILAGCPGCENSDTTNHSSNDVIKKKPETPQMVDAPDFNEDSAYAHIQSQVDFGPRVPNSAAHSACADWLTTKLKRYTEHVKVQNATLTAYDNTKLNAKNIIASFNPNAKNRVLLCAHWDTRPFADQDDEDREKAIDGANDGGSGVGVLLEIARVLSVNKVKIGIDIILFDAEDYGQPEHVRPYKPDTYCLGSQYWAKNPHQKGYRAEFGILLDMVGATNSTFTREGTSMYFAGSTMTKVWDIATKLGYSQYFSYEQTSQLTDDHLYINQIIGIPTIDIIHRTNQSRSGFGSYWHTHDDNMDIIDKTVLKAVGQTVIQVIYNYEEKGQVL